MAKKIGILLLIFIGFYLGAHFYLRWKNRIHVDTIKTTSLIDCQPNDVRGLKILQREGAAEQIVVFERVDQAEPGVPAAAQLAAAIWKESMPATGEANAVAVNRLASEVCELYDPIPQRAEEMVESKEAGRRAQRLEILLVKNGREEKHEIDFGLVGRDRKNVVRYRGDGNERTVKISPQLLQSASRAPKDYLNRRVLRVTTDNVQSARVLSGGKEKFSLERAGADWEVKSGGKAMTPAIEVDRYLNILTTLEALEISPAPCKPQPQTTTVELGIVGGKTETVEFGYGKSGNVQACSSRREGSFTVHREILKHLELAMRAAK